MPKRTALLLLSLPAIMLLVGCGDDFPPQSLVVEPRILGIVASPPELGFDETTALQAVLAFPEQMTALSWSACPLSLGPQAQYRCGAAEIPLAAGDSRVDFAGTELSAYLSSLRNAFDRYVPALKQTVTQQDECLRAAIASYESCSARADPTSCAAAGGQAAVACLHEEGIAVSFHLTATLGDDSVVDAHKRVRFRDRVRDRPANRNPVLDGVEVDGITVHDGEEVTATAGQKLAMIPVLPADSFENYTHSNGATATEVIFFSWFATGGNFEFIRSTPEAADNELTMPPASETSSALTVWMFARDNRLGESCVSFRVVAPADRGAP